MIQFLWIQNIHFLWIQNMQITETDSRSVVSVHTCVASRECVGGSWRLTVDGYRVYRGMRKDSGGKWWLQLYNTVNIETSKLYTLTWWFLWYVNFISIIRTVIIIHKNKIPMSIINYTMCNYLNCSALYFPLFDLYLVSRNFLSVSTSFLKTHLFLISDY